MPGECINDITPSSSILGRQHITGQKITDGGLTRKFWVLPSGEVCSFGCEFHYSFLLNHPDLMQRYEIDPGDRTEQMIRINAVKRGLFRMNYQKKQMHLIIEGVQSLLTDVITSGICKAVQELDCGINQIVINLFNPEVTAVLSSPTRDTSLLEKEALRDCLNSLLNLQRAPAAAKGQTLFPTASGRW
jgi:hypothetical protein